MSYEPKTITIDVWNTPVGECQTIGLDRLTTLEFSYLYREVTRQFYRTTGRSPEEFLKDMSTLLAPAD